VIVDTRDEHYRDSAPVWCRDLLEPNSILLFAVFMNKVCIGLIYADTCNENLSINAQELKLLNTLAKQLTLGLHQR
jgi:GAF domain-containing protein